jgi:triosephosphate isomerase
VAYEPVWAIGTGKTATPDDIRTMHAFIKDQLSARFGDQPIRILYGGSVKPSNAGDIFNISYVHGALIGGASLKSSDFIGIAKEVKELD